ncbi:MAG: trypsin-like peptidase domain-containing protein [Eubacteriales bacterium]
MDYEEGYQPQYPSPNDDYVPKKNHKRWIWRVLLILAIIAIPVWFAMRYHFTWDISDSGFSFSLQPSGQAAPMAVEASPSLPTPPPASAPATPREHLSSETTLEVTKTDYNQDAWSLQDICTHVRPSVVSVVVQTATGQATGTGIVMSEEGYIITNHHVIDDAYDVEIILYDDTLLTASIVGSDEDSDLAVLKVTYDDLTPAQFGDSDSVAVGDAVVAIGDPLGIKLRGTMTDGIISAINRNLDEDSMTLLQTNAALNSGNSGGPLINDQGQVIGINAMKIASQYTATTVEGLGFAIPIANAKPIIDELITQGYVAGQPAVGITGENLPASVRVYYRLPDGIYVTYVDPSSDAAAQGLGPGDLIIGANGYQVTTTDQLESAMEDFAPGDSFPLTVYHQGETYNISVILLDKNAP